MFFKMPKLLKNVNCKFFTRFEKVESYIKGFRRFYSSTF